MIPADVITEWGTTRPWPSRFAIEQDLLLARVIVAIYEHPLLSRKLVLRGGASLHKVHLPAPGRYTEDLDFICSDTDVVPVLDALRELGDALGLSGPPRRWQLGSESVGARYFGENPRMTLRARAEDDPGRQLRIKIEINNTDEVSHPRSLVDRQFQMDSAWFSGSARVLSVTPAEIFSSKLHDLYRRKKGRDLFDLWLGLTELAIDPDDILACFGHGRPDGYTAVAATEILDAKLADQEFRTDLEAFVGAWPDGYDIDAAAALVRQRLLQRL